MRGEELIGECLAFIAKVETKLFLTNVGVIKLVVLMKSLKESSCHPLSFVSVSHSRIRLGRKSKNWQLRN